MLPGFLPARGSFMLDLVCVAMILVSVLLLLSVGLARFGRKYHWHRSLQVGLAMILLVAVVAFEIDVRFFTDWRKLAEPSPYYASNWVDRLLWLHLCFAIPTPFIWGYVVYSALRNFREVRPSTEYSGHHRWWGRLATAAMLLTAVTGWMFYWTAFVAEQA